MLIGSKLYNTSYWITLYMPNDSKSGVDEVRIEKLLKTLEK